MGKKILVPIAEGFEEIEAVTIVDVLRRAELDVTLASLGPGPVLGSRGISILADAVLGDLDLDAFDVLVLPGGMGGTLAMMEDQRLLNLLRAMHADGRLTAAICAAPMVLARAGIEVGHAMTSHPGVRDRLGQAEVRETPRVVRSGSLLTSQGPGTAMEFALALVTELVGPGACEDLQQAMLVAPENSRTPGPRTR